MSDKLKYNNFWSILGIEVPPPPAVYNLKVGGLYE